MMIVAPVKAGQQAGSIVLKGLASCVVRVSICWEMHMLLMLFFSRHSKRSLAGVPTNTASTFSMLVHSGTVICPRQHYIAHTFDTVAHKRPNLLLATGRQSHGMHSITVSLLTAASAVPLLLLPPPPLLCCQCSP